MRRKNIRIRRKGGWQHALTVPREIVWREGKLCQYPVEEIEKLRGKQFFMKAGEEKVFPFSCFDLILKQEASADCRICLAESLTITYQEGVVKIELGEREGRGRKIRQARLESLYEIRILADTSAIEIYLNQGELVFTLRYYPGQAFCTAESRNGCSFCLSVGDGRDGVRIVLGEIPAMEGILPGLSFLFADRKEVWYNNLFQETI